MFGLGLVQVQGVGTGRGMSSMLLETIEQELLAKMPALTGRHEMVALTNSLWGFGQVGHSVPGLVAALVERVERDPVRFLGDLSPSNLTRLFLGLALLGCERESALVVELCRVAFCKIDQLAPENLIKLLWAMVMVQVHTAAWPEARHGVADVWAAVSELNMGRIGREGLLLLARAESMLFVEAPDDLFHNLEPSTEEALRALRATDDAAAAAPATAADRPCHLDLIEGLAGCPGSPFQRELGAATEAWLQGGRAAGLGGTLEFNRNIDDLVCAPISVQLGDYHVAVVPEGPEHFFQNEPLLSLKARAQQRLLYACGWDVVGVPWFEWEACRTDAKRAAYLEARMLRLETLRTLLEEAEEAEAVRAEAEYVVDRSR